MNKRILQVIKMKYGIHRQSEVSKASGLNRSEVNLIWSGKRGLTIETMVKLCNGANVACWEVMKEAEGK